MAAATLKDVIEEIRAQGEFTRMGTHGSLDVATLELRKINSNLQAYFESNKENMAALARMGALKDPEKAPTTDKDSTDKTQPAEKDVKPNSGFLAGLFGGLGGGIIASIGSGLLSAFRTLFSPRALLRVLARVATKFGPIAIVTGIIAAISGGITSFFESEKTSFLGKLGDAFGGAIGQVIEFFSFGLIKKEQVQEFLAPLTNFFDDAGVWLNQMLESPGEAIDTAIEAMSQVGEFFANVLGDLFENLGLADLTKVLFGTRISGEQVTKFITNLFSSNPEDGYFSIIKSMSDIWNSTKAWFEGLYSSLVTSLENAWNGIFGEGGLVDFIWSPFKSAFNWISTKFTNLKETLIGYWDQAVESVSTNFTAVTDWVSSMPGKILSTVEEIWTNAITTVKKNFFALVDYFASLPDKIILGAQQLIIDTLGTFAARQIGITPESIAKKRDEIESKKPDNMARNFDSGEADSASNIEAEPTRRGITASEAMKELSQSGKPWYEEYGRRFREEGTAIEQSLGLSPEEARKLDARAYRLQESSEKTMAQLEALKSGAPGASATNNVVAPTTVGPTYTGPVYNGPVTVNNDSSTSWGLNPNDKTQMAYGF